MKVLNLVSKPIELVVGVFSSKRAANAIYTNLYPSLVYIIQTKGRQSSEARGLLEILKGIAPTGAKRSNFRKRYIDNLDGWRELPADPDKIPFGFWH